MNGTQLRDTYTPIHDIQEGRVRVNDLYPSGRGHSINAVSAPIKGTFKPSLHRAVYNLTFLLK